MKRPLLFAVLSSLLCAPLVAQVGTGEPPRMPIAQPLDLVRFGLQEPLPREEGTIRVAAYNVENLFDDVDDPALSGQFEDIDDTKPDEQCVAVAQTIKRLDADVLCLEEVESRAALDWFLNKYMPDSGYQYIVSLDAGDARGIEQAVLSRFPIIETEQWVGKELGGVHPDKYGNQANWYAGEPIRFHRSPLMVEIEGPGGYRLTLFSVHQKSGRYSGYWREAEARGLVEIIKKLEDSDKDRKILVLGDFNAEPDAESLQIYRDAGLREALGAEMGPEHITHESGRRIDFVLADAPAMAEVADGFVLGTPARAEGYDWRTTPPPTGYASDHYPVVVDLKVGK